MTSPRGRLGVLFGAVVLSLAFATGIGASPGTALIQGIPQRGTVLGEPAAAVTLIQFEDLGCTHCNTFMKRAFPGIVDEYVKTGLVKIDFRGLGVVTRSSGPALRYTLAASRQQKLWQVAQLFYENQVKLDELATDRGVERLVRGMRGLDPAKLVADARSASVRKLVAAHAAEAKRRNVPGTPWFFVKIGSSSPKLVRPISYDGAAFRAILDEALGR